MPTSPSPIRVDHPHNWTTREPQKEIDAISISGVEQKEHRDARGTTVYIGYMVLDFVHPKLKD